MTNAESRRVTSGAVGKLSFYVGELPEGYPSEFDGTKHFGLMELIRTVAKSLESWLRSLNEDREKLPTFFDRYWK